MPPTGTHIMISNLVKPCELDYNEKTHDIELSADFQAQNPYLKPHMLETSLQVYLKFLYLNYPQDVNISIMGHK